MVSKHMYKAVQQPYANTSHPLTRFAQAPTKHKAPSFTGYFACPLKELHLQPTGEKANLVLATQLKKIGKSSGFRVVVQLAKKTFSSFSDIPFNKECNKLENAAKLLWGQDNKVFLERHNCDVLAENGVIRKKETGLVRKLADSLKVPYKKMSSYLDGGNFFIGKDHNGEKFALVGEDSIKLTAQKIAAKQLNLGAKYKETINAISREQLLIDYIEQNKTALTEQAKQAIAKDLNVSSEKVMFIRQPDFHIDLAIRPLKYPYVLVNDASLTTKFLDEYIKKSARGEEQQGKISRLISELNFFKGGPSSEYSSADETISQLKALGFKPIRVPGVINEIDNPFFKDICDLDVFTKGCLANFMNAIVHEKPDGKLVYITNKSPANSYGIDFNQMFESYAKKVAPNIDEIHFVAGPETEKENYVHRMLRFNSGGIHCMSAERPDFKRWNP